MEKYVNRKDCEMAGTSMYTARGSLVGAGFGGPAGALVGGITGSIISAAVGTAAKNTGVEQREKYMAEQGMEYKD